MSRSTSGMIRLSELPDRVLLNILRRRGYALARGGIRFDAGDEGCGEVPRNLDTYEFANAESYFGQGDIEEALIWLERALPDTFAGLATAAVPARSS